MKCRTTDGLRHDSCSGLLGASGRTACLGRVAARKTRRTGGGGRGGRESQSQPSEAPEISRSQDPQWYYIYRAMDAFTSWYIHTVCMKYCMQLDIHTLQYIHTGGWHWVSRTCISYILICIHYKVLYAMYESVYIQRVRDAGQWISLSLSHVLSPGTPVLELQLVGLSLVDRIRHFRDLIALAQDSIISSDGQRGGSRCR